MATKQRRKLKSFTPIVFAVSKDTLEFLKTAPREAIEAFKKGTNTPTDWYNVSFRVKSGLEIAILVYEEITITDLKEAMKACLSIRERFLKTNVWISNDSEIEIIELAVEATGVMFEETTRRIQLDASHIAYTYMKKLIN